MSFQNSRGNNKLILPYRFCEVTPTEKTDKLLVELINTWCKELSKLTGKPWVIEKLRITKYE